MTLFEIIFGWNRGDQPPMEPGHYYVAQIRNGAMEIETWSFNPRTGWNTLETGNPDHEVHFENYFWHKRLEIGGK